MFWFIMFFYSNYQLSKINKVLKLLVNIQMVSLLPQPFNVLCWKMHICHQQKYLLSFSKQSILSNSVFWLYCNENRVPGLHVSPQVLNSSPINSCLHLILCLFSFLFTWIFVPTFLSLIFIFSIHQGIMIWTLTWLFFGSENHCSAHDTYFYCIYLLIVNNCQFATVFFYNTYIYILQAFSLTHFSINIS